MRNCASVGALGPASYVLHGNEHALADAYAPLAGHALAADR
jgi:hypothetical protein